MLAVPAEVAGCPRRVLVTPPRSNGRADPSVLASAALLALARRAAPGAERFVDRMGSFLVLVGLAGLAVGGAHPTYRMLILPPLLWAWVVALRRDPVPGLVGDVQPITALLQLLLQTPDL